MLKYFDEIFGKDLGFSIYMELIAYFMISISPIALPLAVLLSSLMTFGNLGEHFELTAIKGAGISLTRALLPIGVFVAFVSIGAYFSNNYLVTKVNLKSYSLLYDIKVKSPSLDIREGVFYNGIPGYSIKTNDKGENGILRDLIIYDHNKGTGNTDVIIADSGRMVSFQDGKYMRLQLYNGYSYSEPQAGSVARTEKAGDFSRTRFEENYIIFDLSNLMMRRTEEERFANNRQMRTIKQLEADLDSFQMRIVDDKYYTMASISSYYNYHFRDTIPVSEELRQLKSRSDAIKAEKQRVRDSLLAIEAKKINPDTVLVANATDTTQINRRIIRNNLAQLDQSTSTVSSSTMEDEALQVSVIPPKKTRSDTTTKAQNVAAFHKYFEAPDKYKRAVDFTLGSVRNVKSNISLKWRNVDDAYKNMYRYEISIYQKYTQAVACFIMFLIGAPLGSIIKKGGLGFPVLLSIIFFIISYVLNTLGEKWAIEGLIDPIYGAWFSNVVLLPFGLFFLRQARKDARLFDGDFYAIAIDKLKKRFKKLD